MGRSLANGRNRQESQDDFERVFRAELDRLAAAASRQNLIEGVMRVRALGEIAAHLDTPALLDLAIRIEAQEAGGQAVD